MFNRKLALISLGILLFSCQSFALVKDSQLNCPSPSVNKENNRYVLNSKAKTNNTHVYFLQNNASHPILIDHVKGNPGAGAGWASSLSPNQWSVLVVSQSNFAIQCSSNLNGTYQSESCPLKICETNRIVNTKLSGNYWLIEDKAWSVLIQTLKTKGLIS